MTANVSNATRGQVTLEDALKIAQNSVRSGNLYVAEVTYNDILKVYPESAEAFFGLGLVNYHKNMMQEAARFYKKSLEINPDSEICQNAYAVALTAAGQHADAIEAWKKALKLRPNFPEVLCNMAHTYWLMDRHEEARDSAEEAIRIKPDYSEAFVNLSNPLISLGEKEKAIEALQRAMELNPALPNTYINLGNLLWSTGQASEAEKMCRKGVELAPQNAVAHNNLGNVLRDQGHHKEAEACYKAATRLKPDYYQAHNNLCIVLMDLLRFDEAVGAAQYAITFNKDYADAYINLSIAQKEIGNRDQAKLAAQEAIRLKPDSAMCHVILADILLLEDRYEEAEIILKKAMELEPDSARLYLKMADVLEHANRLPEAIEALDKGLAINPEMPELYHKKATTYFISNQLDLSIEALDKCLELNANYVPGIATKCEVLQSLGKMKEALELGHLGVKINNKLPFLYFSLSKVKKFESEDDPDMQQMLKLSENANELGKLQASALFFALYKAWQDMGQKEKAFEALKRGNDIKRETVPYNVSAQNKAFATLKEKFTPSFMKTLEGRGYTEAAPIFILGMPRSGTTLTEQILASHPKVFGAGELPDLAEVRRQFIELTPENCHEMGRMYVERTQKLAPDYKYITDKMPGNFMQIGQIMATLPNAKVIHCMRDPVDTCLSCYKQLFARGQYWSYNLSELADFYNHYEDLMKFWNDFFPGRILNIQYEETVQDVETQARKMLDFIGLEWNDACREPHKTDRPILTASKGQVRKPVYKTSVKAAGTYEKYLEPLIEGLQKTAG
ncbi:MAG: tetratricopeptide repeat protein [Alphaproteobacteria bacterium]|nr:tetratricopeptide repeat protein [Alphaproteobacteria bacterium]